MDSLYVNFARALDEMSAPGSVRFDTFKQDAHVIDMLYHVRRGLGDQYHARVVALSRGLSIDWAALCAAESLGSPRDLVDYAGIGRMSPVTMRYVYFALVVLAPLRGQTLEWVEVGGGYGGQCHVLFFLAPLFGVTLERYTIYDLDAARKMQRKVLKRLLPADAFQRVVHCAPVDPFVRQSRYVFLYSAYALSEIGDANRQVYYDKFCGNGAVDGGFVVWNRPLPSSPPRLLESAVPKREVPASGPINHVYHW